MKVPSGMFKQCTPAKPGAKRLENDDSERNTLGIRMQPGISQMVRKHASALDGNMHATCLGFETPVLLFS